MHLNPPPSPSNPAEMNQRGQVLLIERVDCKKIAEKEGRMEGFMR